MRAPGVDDFGGLRAYSDRGAAAIARTGAGAVLRIDPRLLVRIAFAAMLADPMSGGWALPPGLATEPDGISADLDRP